MNIHDNIAIIPDTNYFYIDEKRKEDFSKLSLNRYYKIRNSFEFLEIPGEIKIFLPEVVLLELLSQYKMDLEREIKKYNKQTRKLNKFIEHVNELKIDIEKHCRELEKKYLEELDIINIPEDKTKLFNEIFKMALDKKAPFVKEDNSDKGFKDSIILLSLLKFVNESSFDKYIFISNDKGFKNNIPEIQSKFSKYTSNPKEKLQIIDEKGFEEWFNEEYELYPDLRKILDEKFIPELDFNYNNNASITINCNKFIIDSCDFIKNQTKIYQLNENEFEVEVYFLVDLNFSGHHPDELYGIEYTNIIQRETYIFEKNEDKWNCKLNDYEYNIYYEPYEEYNDHYPFNKIREKFYIDMSNI